MFAQMKNPVDRLHRHYLREDLRVSRHKAKLMHNPSTKQSGRLGSRGRQASKSPGGSSGLKDEEEAPPFPMSPV